MPHHKLFQAVPVICGLHPPESAYISFHFYGRSILCKLHGLSLTDPHRQIGKRKCQNKGPAITASSGLYRHEGAQYARQNSRGEEISHEQRRNDGCQKQNIVLPANQLLNLFSRNPVSG